MLRSEYRMAETFEKTWLYRRDPAVHENFRSLTPSQRYLVLTLSNIVRTSRSTQLLVFTVPRGRIIGVYAFVLPFMVHCDARKKVDRNAIRNRQKHPLRGNGNIKHFNKSLLLGLYEVDVRRPTSTIQWTTYSFMASCYQWCGNFTPGVSLSFL